MQLLQATHECKWISCIIHSNLSISVLLLTWKCGFSLQWRRLHSCVTDQDVNIWNEELNCWSLRLLSCSSSDIKPNCFQCTLKMIKELASLLQYFSEVTMRAQLGPFKSTNGEREAAECWQKLQCLHTSLFLHHVASVRGEDHSVPYMFTSTCMFSTRDIVVM